nr:uncharacterized protein LOC113724443 [Coffea arabica]
MGYVSAEGRVPYLAFADDTIIFTRCSETCLLALRDFLLLYQQHSGQKVNIGKSAFLSSSSLPTDLDNLVGSTLGFHKQCFPLKYLGVPLARGRMGAIIFDPLLASLRARLFHWSSKLLSMGGKVILLRHVLSSLPLFLLQALCPPKSVLVAMGRICNSFLWNLNVESRRMHWAAWEKLCFPVQEGGLGVRSFRDSARAFACKSWWQLRKNDSLWADFMHKKYIKGTHPSIAAVDRPPASWRRLLAVREFAESQIRWCLGKGFVDFWYDAWCGDLPLALELGVSDPPHFLVGEFFTSQGWNVLRLREWVPEAVVQRIATIFFSPEQDDVMGKGVTLGSRCNCCQQSHETVSHLFLHGTVAKAVWEHFLKTFGLFPANSSSAASMLTHWFLSHSKVSAVHVRVLVPLLVLWFIWKSRNLARFQAGIFTPTQVISQIEEFLGQMGRARAFARPSFAGDRDCPWASLCNPSRRDIGAMLVSWEKPPTGWLKLNSDASVINGKAAGGGVLRDHWGRVVWAYYKEFGDLDVLATEAQSLLFGLQLCVERGVSSWVRKPCQSGHCALFCERSHTTLDARRQPSFMYFEKPMRWRMH